MADQAREYLIPKGKDILVQPGDRVQAGEPLQAGPPNPHDILRVKGEKELAAWLVNEIQQVYRLQGVGINDKHIEAIVRQMLRRVTVTDPGDTNFLLDEQVEKHIFEEENERVIIAGGQPAKGDALLLGITKASLSTESFISASSFQETTKVLTEASINGRVDYLRGLKENVIMGRLIPAGTGLGAYKRLTVDVHTDEDDAPAMDAADLADDEPLDAVVDAYEAEYPRCDQPTLRHKDFDCSRNVVEVSGILGERVERVISLSCDDESVLGPRLGKRWATMTLDIEVGGRYFINGRPQQEDRTFDFVEISRCDISCFDYGDDDLSRVTGNHLGGGHCVEPGKYLFRFSVDEDVDNDYVFNIERADYPPCE